MASKGIALRLSSSSRGCGWAIGRGHEAVWRGSGRGAPTCWGSLLHGSTRRRGSPRSHRSGVRASRLRRGSRLPSRHRRRPVEARGRAACRARWALHAVMLARDRSTHVPTCSQNSRAMQSHEVSQGDAPCVRAGGCTCSMRGGSEPCSMLRT
jgi:hypothetical protein